MAQHRALAKRRLDHIVRLERVVRGTALEADHQIGLQRLVVGVNAPFSDLLLNGKGGLDTAGQLFSFQPAQGLDLSRDTDAAVKGLAEEEALLFLIECLDGRHAEASHAEPEILTGPFVADAAAVEDHILDCRGGVSLGRGHEVRRLGGYGGLHHASVRRFQVKKRRRQVSRRHSAQGQEIHRAVGSDRLNDHADLVEMSVEHDLRSAAFRIQFAADVAHPVFGQFQNAVQLGAHQRADRVLHPAGSEGVGKGEDPINLAFCYLSHCRSPLSYIYNKNNISIESRKKEASFLRPCHFKRAHPHCRTGDSLQYGCPRSGAAEAPPGCRSENSACSVYGTCIPGAG